MFRKILIANRGEVAVRILHACEELGVPAAVVYSEADRYSLHVRSADEAIFIGPADPLQSYLSIPKIIEAAKSCGADAVHPGYGFLSENSEFARAVKQAGMAFIGPPAEAIELMGDKGRARSHVQTFDVPVVPGSAVGPDPNQLAQIADQIGFPVLIKAAAGGGGKGMHIAREAATLLESATTARREAEHAFGDGRLILEKYIPRARHIEFQILADQDGNAVHLFERECSIQRRHQKIIEETPSPFLDPDLRSAMGAAAITAALSAGYQNSGTIEFIVDPDNRKFYFLEMNTRLQVEHPITELVTTQDIVQLQIRIAAGEKLPFSQQDLKQQGHALECRLYAEDPANNFLPATGPVLKFVPPDGPGVRVDAGYSTGDQITIHYDPLVAKIITHAADREAAIRKMAAALRETILLGTTHNGQFLQDVIAEPEFLEGDFYTTWVEEHFGDWQAPSCSLPFEVAIAAALAQGGSGTKGLDPAGRSSEPYSPWEVTDHYRPGTDSLYCKNHPNESRKPG